MEKFKAHIINGQDPLQFFTDCEKFREKEKGNIKAEFPIFQAFPVQAKPVNIPGYMGGTVQNVTMQFFYACTFIVEVKETIEI